MKKNFLFDILLLMLLLIILEQPGTGNFMHEWLGIILFLLLLIHVSMHAGWINCAFRHLGKGGKKITRLKFYLNVLLFTDLVTLMFSGLMISRSIIPDLSIQTGSRFFWMNLHEVSADILLVLTGIHLAFNWQRIRVQAIKMFRSGGMLFISGKKDEGRAIPAPVKQSGQQLVDKHFFNRIASGLKIFMVMLVFSAGISTGWYYVVRTSNGKPAGMQHYRIERHGSSTGFTHRTRHHAGPDRMVQPRVTGVLTGMGQNISILFLLVFLTVMVREHFRSPDEVPPRS